MSGKPIRPKDVVNLQLTTIPGEVFDAFNTLIVMNMRGGSATVRQTDVIALLNRMSFDTTGMAEKGWLNVEPSYREFGWDVTYDKPAYNESYEPTFTFRIRS